jgi:alpha-D-ribose 1-methylphosphonate 5-triphosphate synthase subunit PhnI
MYVAVKGGERAITNAHRLLAAQRRGDPRQAELSVKQIEQQLGLAVERVMTEGSLYDRELAALAIKQAQGDLIEAIFLLRAYRTTLPRFGYAEPLDTGRLCVLRRISAAYKDLPGGQVLGGTYDYTHRLLDFELAQTQNENSCDKDNTNAQRPSLDSEAPEAPLAATMPRIADFLKTEKMVESDEPDDMQTPAGDLTREPLDIPADRSLRLQNLTRGDEGFLLSMGYSVQRGFGASVHPFVGEIRYGRASVILEPEELGFALDIGTIEITECVTLHRFSGNTQKPPQYIKGYGLVFGRCERKAMAMAMVDRALRGRELDEQIRHPAQNEEFILYHSDNVEASGFVQHLKLPHYVDFQADLLQMRQMLADYNQQNHNTEETQEESDDDAASSASHAHNAA